MNAAQPGASNDPDGDGVTNLSEYQRGTNPNRWDTDGDLISDGVEVTYSTFLNPTNAADGTQDHDIDGIVNREETLYGGSDRPQPLPGLREKHVVGERRATNP